MKKLTSINLVILLLLIANHCFSQKIKVTTTAENLYTFGRLYGYVKHFYPGDEARMINWDRFAVYGAEKVKNAKNNKELKTILDGLFKPIAPLVQIGFSKKDLKPYKPAPKKGDVLVSWQHHGLGDSTSISCYKSIRLGRDTNIHFPYVETTLQYGNWLVNKEIRLVFKAKPICKAGSFAWVAVNGVNSSMENNLNNQIKITDSSWSVYEIKVKCPSNMRWIAICAGIEGKGELMIDSVNLFYKDSQGEEKSFPVKNGEFEQYDNQFIPSDWWQLGSSLSRKVKFNNNNPYLSIENHQSGSKPELFSKYAKAADIINQEIGNDIYCAVPMALYLPAKPEHDTTSHLKSLINELSAKQAYIKDPQRKDNLYAGIIIIWNEVQHFYPYFDYLDVNWKEQLRIALQRSVTDSTSLSARNTMSKMLHFLSDRHIYLTVSHSDFSKYDALPMAVKLLDDSAIVFYSMTDSILVGDIILSINDRPIKEIFEEEELLQSGSRKSNRIWAGYDLMVGRKEEVVKIVFSRDGMQKEIFINRGNVSIQPDKPFREKKIFEPEKGIFYVDFRRTTIYEWDSLAPLLVNAKGIIFDLSSYPFSNHDILRNFIDKPIRSANWSIPEVIYPDHQQPMPFDTTYNWIMLPKAPRIKAKVVFLITNNAQSYAESVLEMVETYKLGILVGEPTAGINGMVNSRTLPGSFITRFTGCRVVKQTGKQLFTIGIQPDYLVEPDYESIKNGIDKPLLKAIQIIKSEINK